MYLNSTLLAVEMYSLRGIWLMMASSYFCSRFAVMSEAMKPGATALHVMPLPANSRATVFVDSFPPGF